MSKFICALLVSLYSAKHPALNYLNFKEKIMALSPKILLVLVKNYAPKERYNQKLLGKDITFVTDE